MNGVSAKKTSDYCSLVFSFCSLFISNITGRIIGFLPVKLFINGYSVSVTSLFNTANVAFGSCRVVLIVVSALFSIL